MCPSGGEGVWPWGTMPCRHQDHQEQETVPEPGSDRSQASRDDEQGRCW